MEFSYGAAPPEVGWSELSRGDLLESCEEQLIL